LAIKSGIVFGTVYYVREAGVWEDSEKTAQLYGNIKKSLCPYWKKLRSQIPMEVIRLRFTNSDCMVFDLPFTISRLHSCHKLGK
jgi:pyridoxine/pyridoxamine 5'-phosphate oxidase